MMALACQRLPESIAQSSATQPEPPTLALSLETDPLSV